MVRVVFKTSLSEKQQESLVPLGSNLLTVIVNAGYPIGNSCSAIGICAKCWVQVLEGMENLSKPNPIEVNLLKRENLPADYRISCLTKVNGPVKITTGYW